MYPRSNTTIETCASVVRVRLPSFSNQLITLVHDSVKPNPAPEFPITQVLAEAERDMLNVTSRGAPLWWTTWEDNHDGYGSPLTLNPSLLYHPPQGSPKVGVQCYGNILRTSVPQSMMTIEWNSQENSTYQFIGDANGSYVMIDQADDWAQSELLNEEGHAALGRNCVPFDLGPDVGRDADVDIAYVNEELFVFKGWFKATTSTSDPASAAAAAVRYIGGRRAPSPYESLTPPPGGHYAQWVLMTTNTDDHPRTQTRPMWLHFVYTRRRRATSPRASPTLTASHKPSSLAATSSATSLTATCTTRSSLAWRRWRPRYGCSGRMACRLLCAGRVWIRPMDRSSLHSARRTRLSWWGRRARRRARQRCSTFARRRERNNKWKIE